MNGYRYAIRHIEPLSALKFGFVVGGMVMLLPGFGLGISVQSFIDFLWEMAQTALFAPDLGPLDALHQMGWGLVWLIMVGSIIFGGITGGFSAVLSALLYNLVTGVSGGIIVQADLLNAAPAAAMPAFAAPAAAAQAQQPLPGAPRLGQAAPSSANSGGPSLVAASGQAWPLYGAVTMVGSAPSCDIQVSGLAPIHAEIRLENNRYILYDMSGGQTWVNDRQITTANLLKDGFRVRLGAHEFSFGAPVSLYGG